MILCCPHHLLSPILPSPNKENIATPLAAHCLCHTVFQKHSITDCKWFFGSHYWPAASEEKQEKFQGSRRWDIVWTWAGERLITWDHNNQQIRVTISQHAGEVKWHLSMTRWPSHLPFGDTFLEEDWAWLRSSGFIFPHYFLIINIKCFLCIPALVF